MGETPTMAARLAVLGRRVVALDEEKERLDALLTEFVTKTAPQRLELHGVGVEPPPRSSTDSGG